MTLPADGLLRATPQSRGTDPAVILGLFETIEREGIELHSLLIWHDGALVTEAYWAPFAANRPHMMHSVTKSFTSMAVGLAVGDGLMSIDDPVMRFFPEHDGINPSEKLGRMTVRHLLTMTSGHARGISGGSWRQLETSWVADFLRQPIPHEPGEVFVYDSAASYMLSAIVQKATGRRVSDYLAERIFAPMDMSAAMRWDIGTDGVNTGGNGLSCLSSDLLKLGILHLQGGVWQGRALLSPDWVRDATGTQVQDVILGVFTGAHYLGPDEVGDGTPPEKREGYGYHWWRGPHGSFSANGLFGQYCIVLPDENAVVAFTGGMADDDRRVHRLIYDALRPALGAGAAVDNDTLADATAGLTFRIQPGPDTSAMAPRDWQGRYAMVENDQTAGQIALRSSGVDVEFSLTDARGTHTIVAGFGHWVEAMTTMTGARLHHSYEPRDGLRVLACARWLPEAGGWACLEMDWLFVETAFRDTVRCWIRGGTLRVTRTVNVNSSHLALPELQGERLGVAHTLGIS
ncbi:serine hydrolase domain-containing protein [Pelagibacterium halotolerans]|uniref:serine hydrolase domain-containing protein n=1 Tax=Pelagibacterium halotolerans TaxID=531813 RepID=UPI00384B7850